MKLILIKNAPAYNEKRLRMTLPKKGFRSITVNDTVYKYNVTGEDGGIRFIIGLPDINGQVLIGYISYHSNYVLNFNKNGIAASWSLYQRTIVTPKTIREVILYGLDNNWKPQEHLKQMFIHDLDDKINLQLKKATEFPELKDEEVAVVFESLHKRLSIDFTHYNGEGNIYHKFDTIQLAQKFSELKIEENHDLSCWVLNDFNKALMFIDKRGIVEFENNIP
ncbi:hypothetical protein [Aquimarina algicola]|uniref:Uncharacterized protein n=1 Tax=Aquimarina algicola TaxID=2589995 RepID=A0A504JCU7_9FLAO|nr:hypothetical protein [Aquimarina algicola]TPN86275.1 hypothetical protein FHK87_13495 [Aquimarina algicola]